MYPQDALKQSTVPRHECKNLFNILEQMLRFKNGVFLLNRFLIVRYLLQLWGGNVSYSKKTWPSSSFVVQIFKYFVSFIKFDFNAPALDILYLAYLGKTPGMDPRALNSIGQ